MVKLTKIVATIGPVSDTPEIIEKLITAGVNVFRFNFKHNIIEWHNQRIKRMTDVATKLKTPIGTLIDLQGPEIRINMPVDELQIEEDELLIFGEEIYNPFFAQASEGKGFSISHPPQGIIGRTREEHLPSRF